MRPDTYGPDAVIADREEDYREANPPLGECAICACPMWSHVDTYLCDDCCTIQCPKCEGRQVLPIAYDKFGKLILGECPHCDGDGFLSVSLARALGWMVAR